MLVGRWRRGESAALLPAESGSYVLLLCVEREATVTVGRLGRMRLVPGWYLYCGSANGPGGLRARLGHHLRPSPRPHWHIDHLKRRAVIEEIWYSAGGEECEWAELLAARRGAGRPMPGFGASDCQCETHLLYFTRRPRPPRKG